MCKYTVPQCILCDAASMTVLRITPGTGKFIMMHNILSKITLWCITIMQC